MNTIIAGRFEEQVRAEEAVSALQATGFPRDQIAAFFVDPAGQHALSGTRHDPDASAGAHHAAAGAVTGALSSSGLGAVVGLVSMPILGPGALFAGVAVGAYVGSFADALDHLEAPGLSGAQAGESDPDLEDGPSRKSGMLVAVGAVTSWEEASAITILQGQGAADMEQSEGSITHSEWKDFDPLSPPAWLGDMI